MIENDDRNEFERVVAAEWADMVEVLQCLLNVGVEDAEEWLQDGLLAIWKGFAAGTRATPVANWRAYIVTAAINRGCEILARRAKRREMRFTDLEKDPELPFDPEAPAAEEPLGEAERDRVTRAADLLPPREREIVLARFAESDESLSARLGITVKSVQQIFSRAAKLLRARLKEAA